MTGLRIGDYFIWLADALAFGCLFFVTLFYITSSTTVQRLFPPALLSYPAELGTVLACGAGLLLGFWLAETVFWVLALITGNVLVLHFSAVPYAGIAGAWLIVIAVPMAWIAIVNEIGALKAKVTGLLVVGVCVACRWVGYFALVGGRGCGCGLEDRVPR
jgi:hypothetical protein